MAQPPLQKGGPVVAVGVRKALRDFSLEVSLHIERGEFVVIQGPSGSGKTTLLRIIAGLEKARGAIEVEGERWLDEDRSLPPQKRSIGFVFQNYALFPTMSVLENLLFVQKDESFALHLLRLVDMIELKDRYPHELSGGQKQRVALARAYIRRPKVMLLDEPLSALDPAIRAHLQSKIKELHEEFGTTTFMVSHDVAESYRLADRIVLLERGGVRGILEKEALLSQKTHHLGEVVDIKGGEAYVAFMGQIFRIPAAKDMQVGQMVPLQIGEIRAL